MKLLDRTHHLVFDGQEPRDWHAPLQHPAARGLSLAELDGDGFALLVDTLGREAAAQVAALSGVEFDEGPWGGWRGVEELRATTVRAIDPEAGQVRLIACVGEFQPARWRGWVLSVWDLPEACA